MVLLILFILNSKKACLASLHPQLNQPLPTLFRTSAFVPVNIPLVIGLSILPPTVIIKIHNEE